MCRKNSLQCLLLALIVSTLALPVSTNATDKKQQSQPQQQSGITWAQQAMLALTGGNPVSSVTESGTVTVAIGGNQEQGTVTLQSTGVMTNQITIATSAGNRSETRLWNGTRPSGQWTGLDGQPHQMQRFNCWTDAVWFFPALSLLSGYNDPTLVFTDLGQQQYNGGTVEHIQVYRYLSFLPPERQEFIEQLSTVDYYLDSNTALPLAIAFAGHDNQDLDSNIPIAVVFSEYQTVGGIQIPFQISELLSGTTFLQVNITSASPNGQNLPIQRP